MVSDTDRGVVMSGRRPLIKGYFFGVAQIVGAVMSSAFCAEIESAGPDVVR